VSLKPFLSPGSWPPARRGASAYRRMAAQARTADCERISLEARWDNAAARCFHNEHGYHEPLVRHLGH
jgi:hypothetical protein